MFLLMCDRTILLNVVHVVFTAMKIKPATLEIGVHRGDFSLQILDRLEPKYHHAVDAWSSEVICNSYEKKDNRDTWVDDLDSRQKYYKGPISDQNTLDENYRTAREKLKSYSASKIFRMSSAAAFENSQIKQSAYNYIYVDGAHDYSGALSDLYSFSSLTEQGVSCIQLNDSTNSMPLHKQNAAVIDALHKFLKLNPDWIPLAACDGDYADVLICQRGSAFEKLFHQICRRLNDVKMVEIPDNLLPHMTWKSGLEGGSGYATFK